MTPRKAPPTAIESILNFAQKNPLLFLGLVLTAVIFFSPEIKEVMTHYTGIHFSQEAVASTETLEKLDSRNGKIDSALKMLSEIDDTLRIRHDSGMARRVVVNARIDSTNKNVNRLKHELALEFNGKGWTQ